MICLIYSTDITLLKKVQCAEKVPGTEIVQEFSSQFELKRVCFTIVQFRKLAEDSFGI